MKFNNLIYISLSLLLLNSGCVSYNSLLNYHDYSKLSTEPQPITNFKPIVIQPDDILHIRVSSTNALAAEPFNTSQLSGNNNTPQSTLLSSYLVNKDGYVDFPTLGKVQLEGLDMEAAKEKLLRLLSPYFEEPPIVNIRLLNFKITVNGEVGNPGTFNISSERATMIEALTLAGDFTNYSRRDSILIVREANGERSFGYISFNSAEAFISPYFYLQQNDVVYVRPNKTKVGSVRDPATRALPWLTAATGLTALIISLLR